MDIESLAARLAGLEKQVDAQNKELTRLKDIEAIKKLQRAYNYYVEHMMVDEIIDCFPDHPEVRLDWLEGKYCGLDSVKKYFDILRDMPVEFRHQLMPIGGIVDIDPDGKTAKGRWYAFGALFAPRPDNEPGRSLVCGIYENRYLKEDGVWKMLAISWVIPYSIRDLPNVAMPEEINRQYIEKTWKGPKPDIDMDLDDIRYLTNTVFPFHYNHPVTGKPTSEDKRNKIVRQKLGK